MSKFRILLLAAVAVFAFSAIASSQALAVSKFLLNGAEITDKPAVSTSGEILLEDMTFGADILCSGIFDGVIEVGGTKDKIESVLTLAGVLLEGSTPSRDLIECEAHSLCSNPVDVEAINLPWNTELVLIGTAFVDLIKNGGSGEPGYVVDCNTVFGLMSDECTGETGSSMTNEAGGVTGEFSETNEEITKSGVCKSSLGTGVGLLSGTGLLAGAAGDEISVSE